MKSKRGPALYFFWTQKTRDNLMNFSWQGHRRNKSNLLTRFIYLRTPAT